MVKGNTKTSRKSATEKANLKGIEKKPIIKPIIKPIVKKNVKVAVEQSVEQSVEQPVKQSVEQPKMESPAMDWSEVQKLVSDKLYFGTKPASEITPAQVKSYILNEEWETNKLISEMHEACKRNQEQKTQPLTETSSLTKTLSLTENCCHCHSVYLKAFAKEHERCWELCVDPTTACSSCSFWIDSCSAREDMPDLEKVWNKRREIEKAKRGNKVVSKSKILIEDCNTY